MPNVPGTRGRIGLAPATQARASDIDIRTKAAGTGAAVRLGSAAIGYMAKAAQKQSEAKLQIAVHEYKTNLANKIGEMTDSGKITSLLADEAAKWGDTYAGLAEEAGANVFPLLRGDYNESVKDNAFGVAIDFENTIGKAALGQQKRNFAFIQEKNLKDAEADHKADGFGEDGSPSFKAAEKNLEAHRAILSPAEWSAASKRLEVFRNGAIYDEKIGLIRGIKREEVGTEEGSKKLAAILDDERLDNGQKNALENMYTNQGKLDDAIVEVRTAQAISQATEEVEKVTSLEQPSMASEEDWIKAETTAAKMQASKNKDIRKEGDLLMKEVQVSKKPPSEMAETIPWVHQQGMETAADYIASSHTEEEAKKAMGELKASRFGTEQTSQHDHLKSVSFMGIDVPADSQDALASIVKGHKDKFTTVSTSFQPGSQQSATGLGMFNPTTSSATRASTVDSASAARASEKFLLWASRAEKSELTPEKMQEVSTNIVRAIKNKQDVNEAVSAIKLQNIMASGKLSNTALDRIVAMKRDKLKAWEILESDELQAISANSFAFPEPYIDGNVTTLPFKDEKTVKMAEKEMKALKDAQGLNVTIKIDGNNLVVTELDK